MSDKLKVSFILLLFVAVVGLFLYGLGSALMPLVLAFSLAYMTFPVIQYLERKGMSRTLSVSLCFGILTTFLIVIILIVIPFLVQEGRSLITALPNHLSKVAVLTEDFLKRWKLDNLIEVESMEMSIRDVVSHFNSNLLKSLSQFVGQIFSGVTGFILSLLNLFLIPIFFLYIVFDLETIISEVRNVIPNHLRPFLGKLLTRSNQILSGYLRGQILVAASMGGLYSLGLWVVGLNFGVLIGILSGLLSIIPYAGFAVGFGLALVVSLSTGYDFYSLFGVAIVYGGVQLVEGFLLTPRIVGNQVGIGSLSTMLALILSGNLFGLWGLLIAIPLAGIVKFLLVEMKLYYMKLLSGLEN